MTLIEDVPLPEMPEPPTLWAVHIQGPDDVIAVADEADGEKRAGKINAWYAAVQKRPDFYPETFPHVHAEVIKWPYTAAGHAEDLARGDERWT